jgi:ABC-2 type transport system ATP-binding protein
MPEPALSFRHVTKRFRDSRALADVSFEVQRGECFALAGVNGAGKTTLIKCLLHLNDTDAGSIDVLGVPHTQTRSRQELGYLPERFNPPYFLKGEEFLRFMARMNGHALTTAEMREMLHALDLDVAVLHKPVRHLSKGMTQKLGLASCLLIEKQVYILDEPLSGLDPRARALLKGQLRKLKAQGRTLFFTSHALADIQELCDRMAILHDGNLRFVGTPDALIHAYGNVDLEQAFLRCIG